MRSRTILMRPPNSKSCFPIPEYLRARERNSDLADVHYRLAQAFVRTGENDLAQEQFDVYQRLRDQRLSELDKQRAEIRQFVYSAKKDSYGKPQSHRFRSSLGRRACARADGVVAALGSGSCARLSAPRQGRGCTARNRRPPRGCGTVRSPHAESPTAARSDPAAAAATGAEHRRWLRSPPSPLA